MSRPLRIEYTGQFTMSRHRATRARASTAMIGLGANSSSCWVGRLANRAGCVMPTELAASRRSVPLKDVATRANISPARVTQIQTHIAQGGGVTATFPWAKRLRAKNRSINQSVDPVGPCPVLSPEINSTRVEQ